jgi:hypothetical protein
MIQELMLVASGEGVVVHVTQKMAALLGRTVQQVLANGSHHTLEQLMVEPFSQLHRTLAASIPQTAPPAHSCRSGLSFLMNELGAQGRARAAPFRMSLKPQTHSDEDLHVMCFEKRTLEQVGHWLGGHGFCLHGVHHLGVHRYPVSLDRQQQPRALFPCQAKRSSPRAESRSSRSFEVL